MIETGRLDAYCSVAINSSHNYLRKYKTGDNSRSISALSVTATTTITRRFRRVATFCKSSCPQGKVFKLHIRLQRFLQTILFLSYHLRSVTLEEFLIVLVREDESDFRVREQWPTTMGCKDWLWGAKDVSM